MMMIVYEWAIPFGASEKPRIGLSFITLKSTIKGRYTLPERTSRKDKHVFLRHQQTAATYFEYEILFARFLVLLASRHRPPAFTAFVLEQVQRRNFAVGAQQPQRAFLGVLRRLRNAIQIQRYWACTRHIVKHHTVIAYWYDRPISFFLPLAVISPNSTRTFTSRHDKHNKVVRVARVGLISQHAHCQLLSFSSVNFRFNLEFHHSEPRRLRFPAMTEESWLQHDARAKTINESFTQNICTALSCWWVSAKLALMLRA